MKKYILPLVAITLVLLGTLVFFAVRGRLAESESEASTRSTAEADPSPPSGATIMPTMSLAKMREAVQKLTANDPVQVTLTSFGNGEEGSELHLMIKNNAPCTVVSLSGVAYAYDFAGKAVKANKNGEVYVAFATTAEAKMAMEKSGKFVFSQIMHHVETASLGVAHVDAYACADGTRWTRPKP
jgi:hypothetical protein